MLSDGDMHWAASAWRSGWYEQWVLAEMFGVSISVLGTTYIVLKVAVVGGKSMLQPKDDIEAIEQSLSESAAFLLPLARESSWPCKPELLGWLTMVRDTFGKKDERDIH